MSHVIVYDKALCCSTGVCGPDFDPVLPRFAADLDWLNQQGHHVDRFNLAQDPAQFASSEIAQKAITEQGIECLPLVVVEGAVVSHSIYPTREQLAEWTGTQLSSAPGLPIMGQDCSGETGCC